MNNCECKGTVFFKIVKFYLLPRVSILLVSEDFALLEEPYGVAVAVLGHEGEEVGGLGAGGEVEGVAAWGGGRQLNLLGAAHDVGKVGGGDGLLA